jgi:benzil reductase ((S)-benzoin forming)
MEEELAAFKGERAIFVQNAHVVEDTGILGKLPYDTYVKGLFGNLVAPLVLAEGFIRGCRPGYESGLVMISAESADIPIPALTTYCASKAGLEQWVMAAKAERAAAPGPWIVAVRTGFTDTPTAHWIAALDESIYPRAGVMREELKSGRGMSIDEVGARFWRLLPPPPEAAAIRLGQAHSNQPLGVIKKVERSFT